jgi:dihydropteroate synthase
MSTYLTPRGLLTGEAARLATHAGVAWPLLGGAQAFTAVEITEVAGDRTSHRLVGHGADRDLSAFAQARVPFCGVADLPAIMGVVNVTPDSFSDGGRFASTEAAIVQGIALAEAGAAVIDVGGESTRPGSMPIDDTEEIARVVPVIRALAERGLRVSIDSRHGAVVEAALAAGAIVVNDVTALSDPRSLAAVARAKASVVLMHMQGEPQTMQVNPVYRWAPGDIFDFLRARIAACEAAGIGRERIAVDPGIGFGKNLAHNAAVLNHLVMFHGLGCAVVLGASRKSFIGRANRGEGTEARLPGSLAAVLLGADQGVQIFRVHDVGETRQALAIHRLGTH